MSKISGNGTIFFMHVLNINMSCLIFSYSSLADKFRALFALKNTGGHKAIDWICKG